MPERTVPLRGARRYADLVGGGPRGVAERAPMVALYAERIAAGLDLYTGRPLTPAERASLFGEDRPHQANQVSAPQRAALLADADKGAAPAQLTQTHGLSMTVVLALLKKYRPGGAPAQRKRKLA